VTSPVPLLPEIDFATAPLPDLHSVLRELRAKAGPVAPVVYHGAPTWLIAGHAELTAAFADEEHIPSAAMYRLHAGPVMGKTIQCMQGREHLESRALVSWAFRPKVMASSVETLLEPLARELCDRLADAPERDRVVDLVEEFAHPYPFNVICRMLGLPVDDERRLLGWVRGMLSFPWDPEAALAASRDFTAYLAPVLAERRAQPGRDILSELASAQIEGRRLGDEEIYAFVRLLFPAGSDTTYKALGSLLARILQDGALRRLVSERPDLRAAIVEESLRLDPPVALLPRMCAQDTRVGDVPIAAGTPLLFGIAAAGRDPAVHADPDRFDAERPARRLLSFGHGVHFCLGSHLARREMEVAIGALLKRFPNMILAEPEGVVFSGAVLRGPQRLRTQLRPQA
jgi:cytochrome P450